MRPSVTCRAAPRCSMTRSPTFGDSALISMPCRRSNSGRPMPDRSSSSGVSTEPAQRMTSRRAVTSRTVPAASIALTPATRRPSKISEPALVLVTTVSAAVLASAGRTNASYDVVLRPRLIVDGVQPIRSVSWALASATCRQPYRTAEARIAAVTSSRASATETPSGPPAPRVSLAPRLWSSIAR